MMPEHLKEVGEVTHYYTDIGVAIISLTSDIKVGDRVVIAGRTTDFEQYAESIEIEHEKVGEAHAGDVIGLKVSDHVRQNDRVYVVD